MTVPFVTIILSIGTLLGSGGGVYTSMNIGAGKTLGVVFVLSIVIGTLFTIICLFF